MTMYLTEKELATTDDNGNIILNWKEELPLLETEEEGFRIHLGESDFLEPIENFISTQIIEKLIEDIPEALEATHNEIKVFAGEIKFEDYLKQQLRDK